MRLVFDIPTHPGQDGEWTGEQILAIDREYQPGVDADWPNFRPTPDTFTFTITVPAPTERNERKGFV